jgi:hypothetical protein
VTTTSAWVRGLGLATGIAVAILGLLAWRMPHGNGILGLDLQLAATQSGEVQTTPLSPFLSTTGMKRGDRRTGTFRLRNLTGGPLAVRLRASAAVRDADRSLHLRIAAGAETIFDGPLAALRRPTTHPLALPRGSSRRIDATAYLPLSAAPGFAGRSVELQLTPLTEGAR